MSRTTSMHQITDVDPIGHYIQTHYNDERVVRRNVCLEVGVDIRIFPNRASLMRLIQVASAAMAELDALLATDADGFIRSAEGE